MNKNEKIIIFLVTIVALIYPFIWIIGLILGVRGIIFRWKWSSKYFKLIYCFLILLASVKGGSSYIWYHYFFNQPYQIDRLYSVIEKYPIIRFATPYEPNVYYEIIRKRAMKTFKKLKSLKSLSRKRDDWKFSPEWLTAEEYFGEGHVKFVEQNESLTFYSNGPDKIDDKANILYDPTNGIVSRGDITDNMGWTL